MFKATGSIENLVMGINSLTRLSSRIIINSNNRLIKNVAKMLFEDVNMKINTRTKLIEIATQLFSEKGFAAVSIREVTEAAQVNVSAVSYYFNGKEGLYQAVLEEQFAPIIQALKLAQSREPLSPMERLQFYSEYVSRIHAQRPLLARFITTEVINPTEYGRKIIEEHLLQLFRFIKAGLQEGMNSGDFREDLDFIYTSISLVGILNFYFINKPLIRKIVELPDNSDTEYPPHAFQIFLQGILKEGQKKEDS
jgi:TetR/AcrR family transcriptional regulator